MPRDEGGRIVHRKTDIFNLEASSAILGTFSLSDFLDYAVIGERFRVLLSQARKARIDHLVSIIREENDGEVPKYLFWDDIESVDISYLELIVKDKQKIIQKRRRLIVDYCGGELVQSFEDEIAVGGRAEKRRILFRLGEER